MTQIDIKAVPNQNLSYLDANNNLWNLTLRQSINSMIIDISLNNNAIIYGQRIIPNKLIIPYKYLATNGNFMLTTMDDALPDYTMFNISQILFYLAPSDL